MGDMVARLAASVARRTNTVCMPLSSMDNVCSLTRTIKNSPIFFAIPMLYVDVAILSESLAVETFSGGLT